MGTSTKGLISTRISAKQITDFIIENHDINATMYDNDPRGTYYRIIMPTLNRSIFVIVNSLDSMRQVGQNCMELSLDANDEAIEIMQTIVEHFGGYLRKYDCDANPEVDTDFYEFNIDKFKSPVEMSVAERINAEVFRLNSNNSLSHEKNMEIFNQLFKLAKELDYKPE